MKKPSLLAPVLISIATLQGCATNALTDSGNGHEKNYTNEGGLTPQAKATAHENIKLPVNSFNTTVVDSVHVSPSFYSYETSDMSTSERKALTDILLHLQDADILIQTAEAQQNNDQRIKFRYDWLRKDLYRIKRGVSDHLSSPESQPRAFEPVIGDYRR